MYRERGQSPMNLEPRKTLCFRTLAIPVLRAAAVPWPPRPKLPAPEVLMGIDSASLKFFGHEIPGGGA